MVERFEGIGGNGLEDGDAGWRDRVGGWGMEGMSWVKFSRRTFRTQNIYGRPEDH